MGIVEERILQSIETKQKILNDDVMVKLIYQAAEYVKNSIANGDKVLLCGNGGSASDSLHIAGEFVGRFQKERKAAPAIALNADVTAMSAIANDYGFDTIYERAVDAYMNPGDTFIGISTSGNSENVYRAALKAKEYGGKTIGFLGKDGGKIKDVVDVAIVVPSDCTARIQESHIMIGHIICEIVEEIMN